PLPHLGDRRGLQDGDAPQPRRDGRGRPGLRRPDGPRGRHRRPDRRPPPPPPARRRHPPRDDPAHPHRRDAPVLKPPRSAFIPPGRDALPSAVTPTLPRPSDLARHWMHDPEVVFLNHGSFGGCPRAVLEAQSEFRARMEREPIRWFVETLMPLIDQARAELAVFVRCRPEDLVFVTNAT